jgi:hypothetical protein
VGQPAGPLSSYKDQDTPAKDSQYSPGDTVHPAHEITALLVCTHYRHEGLHHDAVNESYEKQLHKGS